MVLTLLLLGTLTSSCTLHAVAMVATCLLSVSRIEHCGMKLDISA